MPDLWRRIKNVITDGLIIPTLEDYLPFPTYTPREPNQLPMQSDREQSDRRTAARTINQFKRHFERELDYRTILGLDGTGPIDEADRFLERAAGAIQSRAPHPIPMPDGRAQDLIQPLMPMLEKFGVIEPDAVTEYAKMKEELASRPLSPEEIKTLRDIAAGITPEPSDALTLLDARGLITLFGQTGATPIAVQMEDTGADQLRKLTPEPVREPTHTQSL